MNGAFAAFEDQTERAISSQTMLIIRDVEWRHDPIGAGEVQRRRKPVHAPREHDQKDEAEGRLRRFVMGIFHIMTPNISAVSPAIPATPIELARSRGRTRAQISLGAILITPWTRPILPADTCSLHLPGATPLCSLPSHGSTASLTSSYALPRRGTLR